MTAARRMTLKALGGVAATISLAICAARTRPEQRCAGRRHRGARTLGGHGRPVAAARTSTCKARLPGRPTVRPRARPPRPLHPRYSRRRQCRLPRARRRQDRVTSRDEWICCCCCPGNRPLAAASTGFATGGGFRHGDAIRAAGSDDQSRAAIERYHGTSSRRFTRRYGRPLVLAVAGRLDRADRRRRIHCLEPARTQPSAP